MQLRRLVLPAPFGPMIAASSPRATAKLTSWSALTPPKRKERFAISSSAIVVPRGRDRQLRRGKSSGGALYQGSDLRCKAAGVNFENDARPLFPHGRPRHRDGLRRP